MIKAIIFDLDGVLLSTDEFHYLAWKAIADKEGVSFDRKDNNRLRGVSRMASLDIILEKANRTYSNEEKHFLADEKNNIYKSYLENLTPESVSKKVILALDKLKEMGIEFAIGSSSKNTRLILEKVGLTSYFKVIVDGNMITNSKPHPEVFLKAKELLGYSQEECLVVEDAKSGIDAALAGGFEACGVGIASKYKKTTYKMNSLLDLITIVEVKSRNLMSKKENHSIKLNHIKKVYPNGVCAVKDFTLEIDKDEFVVFVGPSGCGKSTVLRMIAGLEEITDGELLIDNECVNDLEPIQRNISMVFQNYALYPHLTVLENIIFPLSIKHVPFKHFFDFKYRKKRKEYILRTGEEIASKIGLTEYLNRKPKNLSGGQRQRVALGRALIRNPIAFLLDEPLSNLDAKMRASMRTEISKLHHELGITFIYVTHDQIEAMTMGTKIVVMKDGYIQQIATPNELFLYPVNKFVAGFIGTPQMNFIKVKLQKKSNDIFAVLSNDVSLQIPTNVANQIDPSQIDKEVFMGIRPKAIHPSEEDLPIKGNIKLVEQLGDEALIYFTIDGVEGEFISSKETYQTFQIDNLISLTFDLSHACFFDINSEKTIRNYEK